MDHLFQNKLTWLFTTHLKMSGSKRSEDAAEGLVALGTGSNKKAKADTTRMIN